MAVKAGTSIALACPPCYPSYLTLPCRPTCLVCVCSHLSYFVDVIFLQTNMPMNTSVRFRIWPACLQDKQCNELAYCEIAL
jgi:hypothetical protein